MLSDITKTICFFGAFVNPPFSCCGSCPLRLGLFDYTKDIFNFFVTHDIPTQRWLSFSPGFHVHSRRAPNSPLLLSEHGSTEGENLVIHYMISEGLSIIRFYSGN